jgi:hypothetical protein
LEGVELAFGLVEDFVLESEVDFFEESDFSDGLAPLLSVA